MVSIASIQNRLLCCKMGFETENEKSELTIVGPRFSCEPKSPSKIQKCDDKKFGESSPGARWVYIWDAY
jgi:hypothetical protein